MPTHRCRAGIKKGGSYASLLPMRSVRATRRGSLGSDAGINRYQEWVQRLPCFPNDRQDPVEVHHPRSPSLGTSDTSYMQQFSGALRRSHPSADPVLVDVLVDLGNKGVKPALRRLIPVHFRPLRMTPSPFQVHQLNPPAPLSW